MQPTSTFKLYYSEPHQQNGNEASPQQPERLQGQERCAIWFRSFEELYKEADSKKNFFIARVEDINKVVRFYEGGVAREWLSSSFRHPSTNDNVAKVQFFEFSRETKKGIKIFKQVFECVNQADLLQARGAMIEHERFDEKVRYLNQCFDAGVDAEVERMFAVCVKEMRGMSVERMDDYAVTALYLLSEVARKIWDGRAVAQEALQKVIAQNPEDVRALADLGHIHYESKEYKEAIDSYKRALRIDPCYLEALRPLFRMLRKGEGAWEEDPMKGIEYYERAFAHKKDRVIFEEMINNLIFRAIPGGKKRAIQHLEKALQDDPEDEYALLHLAGIYEGARGKQIPTDFSKAAHYYNRVLAFDPDCPQALRALGRIYHDGGNGVESNLPLAVDLYERYLLANVDEDETWVRLLLGAIYFEGKEGVRRDFSKAIENLSYVIENEDPLYRQGRKTAACLFDEILVEGGQALLQNNPFVIRSLRCLARYYLEELIHDVRLSGSGSNRRVALLQKAEEVLRYMGLTWVYSRDPADLRSLFNTATRWQLQRKALPYVEQTLEDNPVHKEYLEVITELYEPLHEHKNPIEYLERALALNPNDITSLLRCAALYRYGFSGISVDEEKAARYLQRALEIAPDNSHACVLKKEWDFQDKTGDGF